MAEVKGRRKRARGSIDELPSGALRVRVYAGRDALTGKSNYLTEVVAAGRDAQNEAEQVLTRFLNQVDERRHPKTRASMNQLLDRYIEVVNVDEATRKMYIGYIERTIRPALGHLAVAKVDGEVLDTLYAQLGRCRQRCGGRGKQPSHWTTGEHKCDKRCGQHQCKPMAPSTVRQIHWILSGAFDRAVRWNWIGVTPIGAAEPPPPPRPQPSPPSPEEAARILEEASKDPSWGMLVWLAMTTGARRGELCALRRNDFDAAAGLLRVPASVRGSRKTLRVKDTKTHQQRRVALDELTVGLIQEHIARQDADAARLASGIANDAFLFSHEPDCSEPYLPDSITQRYDRLATRLGIATTLHKLRHYNATELLAAGVDLRTVAGRLGHGNGGTTTLRVYAAWVEQSNAAAAQALASRLTEPRQTS